MYLTQITIYCSIYLTLIHGYKMVDTSSNPDIQLDYQHFDSPTQILNRVFDIEPDKSNLDDLMEVSDPTNVFNNAAPDKSKTINGNNGEATNSQSFRNNLKSTKEIGKSGHRSNERRVGTGAINADHTDDGVIFETTKKATDINENVRSIKLNRRKRGFRSAVVDRIAHGFGKRGSFLPLSGAPNKLTSSDLEALINAINHPSYQMAKQILALHPKTFEEGGTAIDELLQKLIHRYQPVSDGNGNEDTLSNIYKKYYQNQIRGSPDDILLENVYDQSEDLN
ncbi:hypothetical protein ACF0H5_023418 [Mactra antiquata]